MRKIRKIAAFSLASCMVATAFSGCGNNGASSSSSMDASASDTNKTGKGRVYYLNFKPEQDAQWQSLAKAYKEEKGVDVHVMTAAEGTYEQTLTSEMDKSDAPTLFQVNGPVGLANWKDYCYDLSKSEIYKQVTSDDFVLKNGDAVDGIAYVIETYGIIYNKTLLQKYFDSDWSTIKSSENLNNFEALKTVAEEIQAHKDDMGVDGAFTSAGMDSTSDWRFKTHLANMPIYYEYKDKNETTTDAIEGKYLDNYKQTFDLYINNSTADKTSLASKTATDAQTEFKTGRAVFYQNGTWEYDGTKYDEGTNQGLKDEEFGMLPIYIGVDGEEKQGLCTGSENYWCVNKNASEDDINATLDFMNWCVTSDTGTKAMAEDMKFVIPFKDAKKATNPLVTIADKYVEEGKTPVSWNFSSIPSENWKNGVGTALTQYAAGTGEWSSVVTAFVDGWKTERAAANQ